MEINLPYYTKVFRIFLSIFAKTLAFVNSWGSEADWIVIWLSFSFEGS